MQSSIFSTREFPPLLQFSFVTQPARHFAEPFEFLVILLIAQPLLARAREAGEASVPKFCAKRACDRARCSRIVTRAASGSWATMASRIARCSASAAFQDCG